MNIKAIAKLNHLACKIEENPNYPRRNVLVALEQITNELLTHIKDLEADLLTASTRDTAQLELIGKLEAENKRLREVVETMALPAWEDSDVESLFENLRQYAIDALSKDSE